MKRAFETLVRHLGGARIGVCISDTAACAVLASRQRLVWSATIPTACVEGHPDPITTLAQLLAIVPGQFLRTRSIGIALGPAMVQTRHLTRLPALHEPRALAAVVRTNASSFFLKTAAPLETSGVQPTTEGAGWACAVETARVEQLARICRARRLDLVIVPAVAVLPCASSLRSRRWAENGFAIEVHYTDTGALKSVRHSAPGHADPPSDLPALLQAAALGAARKPITTPLAIRPPISKPLALWRIGVAATAFAGSVACVTALPLFQQERAQGRAKALLHSVARETRAAEWTHRELTATTVALAQVAAFRQSIQSATQFLASLTDNLDEDVWLTSLRFDESGGSFVALAPRAAVVVSALAQVTEVTEPSISGAITPEMINGERFERVTVTFRWRRPRALPRDTVAARKGR